MGKGLLWRAVWRQVLKLQPIIAMLAAEYLQRSEMPREQHGERTSCHVASVRL
jgi:hypothetical protein